MKFISFFFFVFNFIYRTIGESFDFNFRMSFLYNNDMFLELHFVCIVQMITFLCLFVHFFQYFQRDIIAYLFFFLNFIQFSPSIHDSSISSVSFRSFSFNFSTKQKKWKENRKVFFIVFYCSTMWNYWCVQLS